MVVRLVVLVQFPVAYCLGLSGSLKAKLGVFSTAAATPQETNPSVTSVHDECKVAAEKFVGRGADNFCMKTDIGNI